MDTSKPNRNWVIVASGELGNFFFFFCHKFVSERMYSKRKRERKAELNEHNSEYEEGPLVTAPNWKLYFYGLSS